ncbi:FG-GAP repeat protein [Jidongwangia harbinensis]|uniref:FG-GAP repeat protein n=1 Tax=Jidongwangia harbinensis TaxID=2878561 RepID=UPI001CDA4D1D|nr:FG-GAP repeat protein [Jidongwangia harbinensis]MCA2218598.1 trypsin-like serine protease [Jidongwangia harbinensis]
MSATGGTAARAAGGPVAPTAYDFVTRLQIGTPGAADARSCTGVLIGPRAVLTARECVAGSTSAITAVFRSGAAVKVVDVRPDAAPNLSLAILTRPVTTAAIPRATAAAAAGDALTAVGFGRTADTWVPTEPHAATFAVEEAAGDRLDLAPAGSAGLCRGDAGAPLVRDLGENRAELVAVARLAGQKGCIGSSDTTAAVVAQPVPALTLPAASADPFDQLTLTPTDAGVAPVANAGFGTAVATADFNKDGFLDVAVGAPADTTGAANDVPSGTVTVFAGGRNGPAAGKRLLQSRWNAADEAGDRFGSALATGDFNKDGYADLAIGTPGEVVGTIKAGAIAVFSGSANGLDQAKGFDQNDIGRTDGAGDEFGKSLAAGDFNADGYTDLAIGTPGKVIDSKRSGEVTVLKGSASGLVKAWFVNQSSAGGANEAGDLFGASVAAGNVLGPKTGTVHADLVVGAPGEAPGEDPQGGAIFIIPGSANGPVTSGGVGPNQAGNGGANETGDRFGAAVAVGDFNKDGWGDVAIGIPGEAPNADPQSGTVTVLPGGNTAHGAAFGLAGTDFANNPNRTGDLYGSAFATGDVNADGYADLLIGAPGRNGNAGVLYAYAGGAVSTARPKALTALQMIRQQDVYGTDEADDRFAAGLVLGDLNKDGKADAIVGSPGEAATGEPNAGSVTTLSRVAGTP